MYRANKKLAIMRSNTQWLIVHKHFNIDCTLCLQFPKGEDYTLINFINSHSFVDVLSSCHKLTVAAPIKEHLHRCLWTLGLAATQIICQVVSQLQRGAA